MDFRNILALDVFADVFQVHSLLSFHFMMPPVFHSEFIGLDWPVLLLGHIIMFCFLAVKLDWSWIPLTEHEKLCGSDGDDYRAQVSSLEKTFHNS